MRTLAIAAAVLVLGAAAPAVAGPMCMCGHSLDEDDDLDLSDLMLFMGCDASSGTCCADFDVNCDGFVDGCDYELLQCVTNFGMPPSVCCAEVCGACQLAGRCVRGTRDACGDMVGMFMERGDCPGVSISAPPCPKPTVDAGPPMNVDAGPAPSSDAGVPPMGMDAGGMPVGPPTGDGFTYDGAGGCHCRAAHGRGGPMPALLLLLGVFCLARRARRRG